MRYEGKQSKFLKVPLIWPTLIQIWIFFLGLHCLILPCLKTILFTAMKIYYISSQNMSQYYFLIVLAYLIF